MQLGTLGQGGFSQCNEMSYMFRPTLFFFYLNDAHWIEIDYQSIDNYSSQ